MHKAFADIQLAGIYIDDALGLLKSGFKVNNALAAVKASAGNENISLHRNAAGVSVKSTGGGSIVSRYNKSTSAEPDIGGLGDISVDNNGFAGNIKIAQGNIPLIIHIHLNDRREWLAFGFGCIYGYYCRGSNNSR